jgi:hypothetical protein
LPTLRELPPQLVEQAAAMMENTLPRTTAGTNTDSTCFMS